MKKLFSKEAKIGLAFIIALFILYFGINFLKGVNIFKPSNSYTVVFDDVTDLTLSSPVKINGFQVGLVSAMTLDEENVSKVNVQLTLNKGIKIHKGSKITMVSSLMGSCSLLIEPNLQSQEFYTENDKIEGVRELGMMETVSQGMLPQVANLVPKIDSILTGLNVLMNNPALAQSLQNVNAITSDLALATKQLNQILPAVSKDMLKLSSNMNRISTDFTSVSGQFKAMDFKTTYNSLDSTMKNVQQLTNKLNSKENSLGLLLNDTGLYDSLNVTIGTAGQLMKDVKQNPSKYINVKVF
ncbi:MAG: hypothetical protein RL662_939 [Bacteroidota bacterium]|jgi:phospholipid/cholesterol/gamma-HCH transport system substrate-binding protein